MRRKYTGLLILLMMLLNVIILVMSQDVWVVEINGIKYLYSDFISRYETFVEIASKDDEWVKNKKDKKFMKEYFNQNYVNEIILWEKLKKDKYLSTNARILASIQKEVIVNLYIAKIIAPTVKDPSDDEVASFYDKNKQRFANRDVEDVEKEIKNYLKGQKLQEILKNKIDKIKETTPIKRNPDYFEKSAKTDWVLKIGADTISYNEFNGLFSEAKKKMTLNDVTSEYLFLEQFTVSFVNQFLLYNKEIKKTDFEKKFGKSIEYLYQRNVMEMFVTDKMKDKFKPVTQDQIVAYYQANKSQFANMPQEQAYQAIAQQMNMQRFQMLMQSYVQALKDENTIKKNDALEFLQS